MDDWLVIFFIAAIIGDALGTLCSLAQGRFQTLKQFYIHMIPFAAIIMRSWQVLSSIGANYTSLRRGAVTRRALANAEKKACKHCTFCYIPANRYQMPHCNKYDTDIQAATNREKWCGVTRVGFEKRKGGE